MSLRPGWRSAIRPKVGSQSPASSAVGSPAFSAAVAVEINPAEAEPEVALVANIVANSQARLPVTSDLYKVPHLLSHSLTVGNAFATLKKVVETGRYSSSHFRDPI